jgi:hypothetical protein
MALAGTVTVKHVVRACFAVVLVLHARNPARVLVSSPQDAPWPGEYVPAMGPWKAGKGVEPAWARLLHLTERW